MKLVFLPGLDGTDILFNDLIKALPKTLNYEAISLPELEGQDYSEQAVSLEKMTKEEILFLVVEFYSGRLAYELCQLTENRVKEIVFIVSFVSPPSAISRFSK
ncbi:hypothetical protein ACJJJB_06080 [Microbulbifer sp. ANSA001]|uniref:hypothetical protein n=1 Tax=Microbulbifer sp. ANSA001 TaxID=3243358 RepID=UPI004041B0AC